MNADDPRLKSLPDRPRTAQDGLSLGNALGQEARQRPPLRGETAFAADIFALTPKAKVDERLKLIVALDGLDLDAFKQAAWIAARDRRQAPPIRALPRRDRPRSPDRQASVERRRQAVNRGVLLPWLARRYRWGEVAALTIIAENRDKRGRCTVPVAKIAGLAGICHSYAQEAVRIMRSKLGLVIERRQSADRNLPNVVTITDPEWLTWLEIRRQGGRPEQGVEVPPKERGGLKKGSRADSNTYRPFHSTEGQVALKPRPAQRDLPAWFTEFRASLPP